MALWQSLKTNLNFYRIHTLAFTFLPLIFASIFYASNGVTHVDFVDSLFLCVSAMTVCGLATVELSLLTPWQQVLLFTQMCLGSPVFVSWFIVLIRRYYFAKSFKNIVAHFPQENTAGPHRNSEGRNWSETFAAAFHPHANAADGGVHPNTVRPKLRPDMIRRVDDAPKPVNPSGWISERPSAMTVTRPPSIELVGRPTSDAHGSANINHDPNIQSSRFDIPSVSRQRYFYEDKCLICNNIRNYCRHTRRLSDPGTKSCLPSLVNLARYETTSQLPRIQTVEFAPRKVHTRGRLRAHAQYQGLGTRLDRSASIGNRSVNVSSSGGLPNPQYQRLTTAEDFGGFPMPHEIIASAFRRVFPKAHNRLFRTLTLPTTMTMTTQRESPPQGARPVSYLRFNTTVGRNSSFHHLTNEQLEELGGVEYRALNALLWIVGGYHVGLQLVGFIIVAPYISTSRWRPIFESTALHQSLVPPWFALFQVVSAYTNTGLSLVDHSMLPFQRAYVMIFVMTSAILAGNTAFPIFLRFTIWALSKCVSSRSRLSRTLQFLLDHPRRCFIYLFPSHQTWFLLTVLFGLTFTDWFFFIVLDLNHPGISSIPFGTRCAVGLMQAVAVRAAGFGIVVINALAPAVKFLYVVMMYISVFPIAMSVRTTNVYEDQSLGVYPEDDGDDGGEGEFQVVGSRVGIWGRYLSMHLRKQLAFDMWWIALAIFVVCIIEQGNLENPEKFGWFNIFNVVFELVSAYGTVGLSLGAPTTSASFCSVFHPLSKLIICAVMIRGRHRGLPVAIDRAVLLPDEFKERSHHFASPLHRKSKDAFTRTNVTDGPTEGQPSSNAVPVPSSPIHSEPRT